MIGWIAQKRNCKDGFTMVLFPMLSVLDNLECNKNTFAINVKDDNGKILWVISGNDCDWQNMVKKRKYDWDIVIRKKQGKKSCMGYWVIGHKEVYCTGEPCRSPDEALQKVLEHIIELTDDEGDSEE